MIAASPVRYTIRESPARFGRTPRIRSASNPPTLPASSVRLAARTAQPAQPRLDGRYAVVKTYGLYSSWTRRGTPEIDCPQLVNIYGLVAVVRRLSKDCHFLRGLPKIGLIRSRPPSSDSAENLVGNGLRKVDRAAGSTKAQACDLRSRVLSLLPYTCAEPR